MTNFVLVAFYPNSRPQSTAMSRQHGQEIKDKLSVRIKLTSLLISETWLNASAALTNYESSMALEKIKSNLQTQVFIP